VQNLNMAVLEHEMRVLAEQRIQAIAGDAPTVTMFQLGKIWRKSPSWIAKMRAAGRIPCVPFGNRIEASRAVAIMGLVRGV
jgi:hypothetical protein